MAEKASFEILRRPVGFADIVFAVRKNGKKFGELRISQGSVVWTPAVKSKGRRLSSNQIDELATVHGKSVRVGS